MSKIKLIVFDLSGTTIEDDNAVAKSLHQAATEYGLKVPLEDFQQTIGTNKSTYTNSSLPGARVINCALPIWKNTTFPSFIPRPNNCLTATQSSCWTITATTSRLCPVPKMSFAGAKNKISGL